MNSKRKPSAAWSAKLLCRLLAAMLILVSMFCFCGCNEFIDEIFNDLTFETNAPDYVPANGELNIYCIDVGQGDSSLLISPDGKTMLIDAGDTYAEETVVEFIEQKGIDRIDVVIATHPHSDHIGSMAAVIERFGAETMYVPDVSYQTKTYKNLLDTADKCGTTIEYAWSGMQISWSELCVVTVLAPVEGCEYSSADMNEWSIILRVQYGVNSMIFTGDAETHSEQLAMFNNEEDMFDADVLKVGHHGSSTSTCDGFLDAVSPKYAVISVGEDNKYGHPHKETVEKLKRNGIIRFYTNKDGNIRITMTGDSVEVTPCK